MERTAAKRRRPGKKRAGAGAGDGDGDDDGKLEGLTPAEEKRIREEDLREEDFLQRVVHRADFLQFRLAPYLDRVEEKQRRKALAQR